MIVIITSIVSFQSEQKWSLDFDTMRSPFNIPAILCLCPAILFLSFFFLNFHTDIVIRHCYTSCKWKTIIYSTCCVNKVKFSKWNLIFDRIKRKKFVSKGLRGKLRREIELDENEVVPSPVVDSINSASTAYTCVTSVNDLSYITMYIYNSNNNNNNYNVIIMRAWRGTRAVPRRSFRFISLFVGEIDL